ncbi:hypothetical protein BC826DRAFT_1027361 [Russula brevipes]|nr:hypothetical protein BC826DRAFT_1027361 [Russula brevipes]
MADALLNSPQASFLFQLLALLLSTLYRLGHPKTLRDLTNASTLLTLPSSFGVIQLGETFSGALAVNNESAAMVDGVSMRVEMQTATNKVLLAELGGPTFSLITPDMLEAMVHHEIKELGQHVLACIVSYQLPPGARRPAPPAAGTAGAGVDVRDHDSGLQTFRKFYKFAVTNPLSVKTKVHVPRSPSALPSTEERTKPMWFERVIFGPAPGWHVQNANLLPDGEESIFSGEMAMMQPQDTRQLDISWRSSFGEPGRLLTSMLTSRIPLPPSQPPVRPPRQHQPVSALPLHLQRSATVSGHSSQPPSRPGTPPSGPTPYRPSSPFRNRPTSVPPRPHSPGMSAPSSHTGGGMYQSLAAPVDPVDVDLIVRSIPRDAIRPGKPFRIACTLGMAASVREGGQHHHRTLSLAVQHVQPSAAPPAPEALPPPPPAPATMTSPTTTITTSTNTPPNANRQAVCPRQAPPHPAHLSRF